MINLLQVAVAECRRELAYQRSYRVQFVASIILYALGFLLMTGTFSLLAGGGFDIRDYEMALVGFLTWQVAFRSTVRVNAMLSDDAQWGTLEQVWLSTAYPGWLQFSRNIAVLIVQSVVALIIAVAVTFLLHLTPSLPFGIILVFALTMVGVIGVSFLFVGLNLAYKNIDFVAFAFSSALLFLTGAWAPLENAPALYVASRFLPLASGITLMQQMVATDASLRTLIETPDWPLLLINSAAYLLLGIVVLGWGQRVALRQGSLAHY